MSTMKASCAWVGSATPWVELDWTSNVQSPLASCPYVAGLLHGLNAGGGEPARSSRHAKLAPALELSNANVAVSTPIVLAGPDVIAVSGWSSLILKRKVAGVGSTGPTGEIDRTWNR